VPELHTDRHVMFGTEALVRELEEKARLPHASITDDDVFEEVVVVSHGKPAMPVDGKELGAHNDGAPSERAHPCPSTRLHALDVQTDVVTRIGEVDARMMHLNCEDFAGAGV